MSKPVLLHTASGDTVAIRRPIGFARSVDVSPVDLEEETGTLDNAVGTQLGSERLVWNECGTSTKRTR